MSGKGRFLDKEKFLSKTENILDYWEIDRVIRYENDRRIRDGSSSLLGVTDRRLIYIENDVFRDVDLGRIQSVETCVREEGSFISDLFWFGKHKTVYVVRFRMDDDETLEVLTRGDIRSEVRDVIRENIG